jgi:hypothetical protein
MKPILLAVILSVSLSLASHTAEAGSALAIFKTAEDTTTIISDFGYDISRVKLEFRHNYDWLKTYAAFAGYEFTIALKDTTRNLTFTPMLGALQGEYCGFGPQLETSLGDGKSYNYFLNNQYSIGNGSKPDFTFNYLELSWVVKGSTAIGLGGQLYHEFRCGFKTQADLGPQVMVYSHGVSCKLWYTWGTSPKNVQKSFVFLGISL